MNLTARSRNLQWDRAAVAWRWVAKPLVVRCKELARQGIADSVLENSTFARYSDTACSVEFGVRTAVDFGSAARTAGFGTVGFDIAEVDIAEFGMLGQCIVEVRFATARLHSAHCFDSVARCSCCLQVQVDCLLAGCTVHVWAVVVWAVVVCSQHLLLRYRWLSPVDFAIRHWR